MKAKDLRQQQALDAIQQINVTGNLHGANNRVIFFIIEEVDEAILDSS